MESGQNLQNNDKKIAGSNSGTIFFIVMHKYGFHFVAKMLIMRCLGTVLILRNAFYVDMYSDSMWYIYDAKSLSI